MLKKIREVIHNYKMILPGELVIVAVSGGPDSMSLLHCLNRLSRDLQCRLHVVHVNHGLRTESDEEAEFVTEYARNLGISVSAHKLEPNTLKGGSLQELAREARRKILLEEYQRTGAAKIALGHNANDQAETMLQRLFRGGGTGGLGGMYPVRDNLIRPLLFCERTQIEQYIDEEKIPIRMDPSNQKTIYLRNKLRLELIPSLEAEYNPRLVETLCKTALILQEDENYLLAEALREYEHFGSEAGNCIHLAKPFCKLPKPICARIVRIVFSRLAGEPRGLAYDHVNRVLAFAERGQSGSHLELPFGVKVYKEQDGILFSPGLLNFPVVAERQLLVPGDTAVPELQLVIRARVVDNPCFYPLPEGKWSVVLNHEQIKFPLAIRGRMPGDKIWISGSEQKLKEIFNERRIPIRLRGKFPLVVQEGEIIWIPGLMRSDKAKVTPSTVKVLELVAVRSQVGCNEPGSMV